MAAEFIAWEFFCGGGMARAGLGPRWRVTFANDRDARKAAVYRANWGGDALIEGDVAALDPAAAPGRADLAWASFPCQDLSLAGRGGGLGSARSGALWPFLRLIAALDAQGRGPAVIALENVVGLASLRGGRELAALAAALAEGGRRVGARMLDASAFTPQSRPRLFVVAVADGVAVPPTLLDARAAPAPGCTLAWRLPEPPPRALTLDAMIEAEPCGACWFSAEKTARLAALMSPRQTAALERARIRARALGRPVHGAAFRRTRADGQRLEARFDGLAGCLRTPAGGSSRQILLEVGPERLRARLMTPREAARLMGLPDTYRLPERGADALHLLGDGVVAPVVRHLAAHLLEPLALAARAASRPLVEAC